MNDARALLLTDLVDSTGLAQALGDAALARWWDAHDRAARDLLPRWRGREIDKSDGLLLLFDDVAEALGYALDYHRALARLAPPLQARAGIHHGPVWLRSAPAGDVALGAKPLEVDGRAKPLAARVMALASPGQTLLTADALARLGEAPVEIRPQGHWRLQGLDEPVALFEAVDAQRPCPPPADGPKAWRVVARDGGWQPAREIRHRLPAERDPFVGRQAALHELARAFRHGARLVTVLGMGGTGKTRLALRHGREALGEHPGGVWYCDLAEARDADGIARAVAEGLEIRLGRGDALRQLGHAIAGRGDALLLLDNFEQVAGHAEATLGRWLAQAPRVRMLVTSRERLGIGGEAVLDLPPLAADDAAQLFALRAQAVRPGWQPQPGDAAALRALIDMLDGLPLAIELAAARSRVMSPADMLARMSERFQLLRATPGRAARQATLQATFDWSWALLPAAEKAALAQLSVFRGGFPAAAAEAMLSGGGTGPAPLDLLQALVDKSWVRVAGDARFALLESVREYAAQQLAAAGQAPQDAAMQRHGEHFAALPADAVLAPGFADMDNLVAACRRATARGDAPVALRCLSLAWAVIEMRGPIGLGIELSQGVLAMPGLTPAQSGEAQLVAGSALWQAGRSEAAQAMLAQAAEGGARRGDAAVEGRALRTLAELQARAGHIDQARAGFERALALTRQAGDPVRECGLLNAMGALCESTGELAQARAHYEAGLRLARAAGLRRWIGGSAGNLAQCLANQGRLAEAEPLYRQAIDSAQAIGDRAWAANAHCNLGLLLFNQGQLAAARAELAASLAAAREIGHALLLGVVQCNLGLVAEAQGDLAEARACHEAAVAIAHAAGDRRAEGQFLGYLGGVRARQGELAPARALLDEGERLLRSVNDRVSLGILLCTRAEVEHAAGDAPSAEHALARASALAGELQDVGPDSEFGQALSRCRQWASASAAG